MPRILSLENVTLLSWEAGSTLKEALSLFKQNPLNRDLAMANFRFMGLEDLDFSGLNLIGASFNSSNIRGCSFNGASLQNADFFRANIIDTSFDEAYLNGASFLGASLDLRSISLQGTYSNLIQTGTIQIIWDNTVMIESQSHTIEEWDQLLKDDIRYLSWDNYAIYQAYRAYLLAMRVRPPPEVRTLKSRFDRIS
jgi:hypothetical protein